MSTNATPDITDDEGPVPLGRTGPLLVVSDVDSTFIRDEVIELLARHAGVEEQVAAVTAAAMRGELDFAASLRARVATLAGLPFEVVYDVRREVRLTDGAWELSRGLAAAGHTFALVSGGFDEVVRPLARRMDIAHVAANRLDVADGRLTGRVSGRIVDRSVKAGTLVDLAARLGIPLERTVAIGDGANDLEMMATAAVGIAFCAKPVVREAADIVIDTPDLRLVLDALGVARP